MKTKRDLLIRHLHRISCKGQINEVVFSAAFAAAALSLDHLLLVLAPTLPKTNVLFKKNEDAGIADLSKLIRALGVLSGAGKESVDVEIRHEHRNGDHCIVIDEDYRGLLKLLVAAPKTIGTSIEQEVVGKLLAKAPKANGVGIPLTRALVDGIRETFSLLKAEEIELQVGPDGGVVRVGGEHTDSAEFTSEDLKSPKVYTLTFGGHFVDVLSTVVNFNEAMLYLGNPKSPALVDDVGYQYLLLPKSKPADG